MEIFPKETQTPPAKKFVRTATAFGWFPKYFIHNTIFTYITQITVPQKGNCNENAHTLG